MDMSVLSTPASEYDKQRAGAHFTVRSANSPSYSLTRRPGVRKYRGFPGERESSEEACERKRYGTHTGTNGTNKEEDSSGVKGQCEEKAPSGHEISSQQNLSGTEFDAEGSNSCSHASQSRGRTDWRRYDPPSRSKSLDWRTASPDQDKMTDMLSTKRGFDERRTDIEGVRGRVISSIQVYDSACASNVQEMSSLSHMSQTFDRASRGHSLPIRLRSLSGPGSGVRGTSSFGHKGGQSITERIEKLYGSAAFGKTEDYSKIRDFSTAVPSHHKKTTTDILVSPQQRSYDGASGGTFPRRFSSGERSSLFPAQIRKSYTWTQKDILGSETSSSPGTCKTRERLSGVQWQGQIQGRYSEEGGVNWRRGLEETGTRSLDRARSRYSIAAQIRATRAAAGITAPPESNTILERSASLRDSSSLRERASESKDQDINGTLRGRTGWLEEHGKETNDGAKERTKLKSCSADEDVFESNPQKMPTKTAERKNFPERLSAVSAASVRNKISQFEALSQRAQGSTTAPRRAFSVPTQLSRAHDGLKKSGSAKAIGGVRFKWEGLKEGEEADDETEEKVTRARKRLGSNRSLSVDEVGLRSGRKEREENDLVENERKETDSSNNYVEDFGKYSRLKTTLEIPLNGGAQRQHRNFYIDETDFRKISSPEEASERMPPSSLLSDTCDTSAGVQKTTPLMVTSPASDEDKTPTNSPYNSPFHSPTSQTEYAIPIADSENNGTSILTQGAESPKPDSPPLPHPLATSSRSNLHDVTFPDVTTARPNGKKQAFDLDAWVAGLDTEIKVWDDNDYEDDDDDSTQRDDDSNYDSDSGESSVTITSDMSQSDHKSFCVSLSDLCNFAGVEYESETDSNEWQSTSHRTASLSSDMSALSYVSVMPSEELDRLLEDVRSIGDSTLQDYDDVQVVVLHKDMGVGLGFSVAGGVDQNKPVTVHKVFHSGVAAQEGSIREGDQVLSINGTALSGYAHWEALRVLRRAKTREMGVVVLRRGEINIVSKVGAQTTNQGTTQTQFTETGQQLCVRLEKNSRDLGFSLEGGADSNLGNRPLTVQKIFQGGPVDKVFPGDELEEIEGISVVGMRRLEAWTLIRRLATGPVDVVLRRPLKHRET